MNKDLALAIVDAINSSGGDANIYEDYSGRGMYGQTTTGVVVESGDIIASIISYADLFVDQDDNIGEPLYSIHFVRSDSLGHGKIYY